MKPLAALRAVGALAQPKPDEKEEIRHGLAQANNREIEVLRDGRRTVRYGEAALARNPNDEGAALRQQAGMRIAPPKARVTPEDRQRRWGGKQ